MNQHYVPRIYLKHFAEKDRNEFFVDVYDKSQDRHFRANTKKVLAEKDLYTLEHDNKIHDDIFIVEKIYSDGLEPLYPKAYDILTDDRVLYISDIERSEILVGIFQLYMRNPRFLKDSLDYHETEIKRIYNSSIKIGSKGLTYIDEDFSFREWNLESIIKFCADKTTKIFKETHLIGTRNILKFHQNARIEVNKVIDDSELLTGDNPLISKDPVYTNVNALMKSKEFILPLNKKYVLSGYFGSDCATDFGVFVVLRHFW